MGTFPPETLFAILKLLGRMFAFQLPVKPPKQELAQENGGSQDCGCLYFSLTKCQSYICKHLKRKCRATPKNVLEKTKGNQMLPSVLLFWDGSPVAT